MRIIKVQAPGHEPETVFWHGVRDTLEDIREVLVKEYDFDNITVEEVVDEEEFW